MCGVVSSPVDAGVNHVFRPMTLLQPLWRVPEVGVLLAFRLALHGLGTGRYQVLDRLDSILAEALRQPRPECGHALGHAVRAEMLVECVSSASAFGVSCALKLCFMERWTATADLSFCTLRIAKCAIPPFCHFLR